MSSRSVCWVLHIVICFLCSDVSGKFGALSLRMTEFVAIHAEMMGWKKMRGSGRIERI